MFRFFLDFWPIFLVLINLCLVALMLRYRHHKTSVITLVLGDRTYEFTPVLKLDEFFTNRNESTLQAKAQNANAGEDDALWILNHQYQISAPMRGFNLIFPAWRAADHPGRFGYFFWSSNSKQWIHSWWHDDRPKSTDDLFLVCRRVT